MNKEIKTPNADMLEGRLILDARKQQHIRDGREISDYEGLRRLRQDYPQVSDEMIFKQERGSGRLHLKEILIGTAVGAGFGLFSSTVGVAMLGLSTESAFAKFIILGATAIGGYFGFRSSKSSGS